jgi:hypothetical protein
VPAVRERALSIRGLNRATLARQLLLERASLSVPRAIERLCALQAQWTTSPYVALWSRVRDFRRSALTRALERRLVVRSTLMRSTLHLVSAEDYLVLAGLWRAWQRERFARGGGDVGAAEAASREAPRLGEAFSTRYGPLVPIVHVPPAGTWRHHGRIGLAEAEVWLGGALGSPAGGAALLVERYLGGYGPASLADLLRFSKLRAKDVSAGLEALEPRLRRLRDEDGRELLDLARRPLPAADTPASPRFLGRWDNALLGYDGRRRILPNEYAHLQIGIAGDQPFLVDGFIAGLWTVERTTTAAALVLEPLAPLPRGARREVEDEAARLLAWHEPEADARRVRWS